MRTLALAAARSSSRRIAGFVTGTIALAAIVSAPSNGTSPAQRAMAACVAAAEQSLHITNPYFIPTRGFRRAHGAAVERGVQVQVIMPGPYHDQPIVRRASRHTWRSLVDKNVELYEYLPTMIHAKTLVVDNAVILVGSINCDPRSFSLNAEAGIVAHARRDVLLGPRTALGRSQASTLATRNP